MAAPILFIDWLAPHEEAIGFGAAILTTVAFAPQLVRTWRTGGAGLSWITLALFGSGVALWLVYGIVRNSQPVILANALTGLQVFFLMLLKLWRPNKDLRRESE